MKYELIPSNTGEEFYLKALHDIPMHGVKAGDQGGAVFDQVTLSQEGECWIARGATVNNGFFVYGNAFIDTNSRIMTKGSISNDAKIGKNCLVESPSLIMGDETIIEDNVRIFEGLTMSGRAKIKAHTVIYERFGLGEDFNTFAQTVFTARRADGYLFKLGTTPDESMPIISAGCRYFVGFEQAENHWRSRRPASDPLTIQTFQILDYFKAVWKTHKGA